MEREKIGIIDLGSNSARLVIVEMLGDGHYMVVDQIKESLRLGKDMERDGFLNPQRIAETLKTIKMFRRLCDAYGIEKIIAVATAAVRRAKNQRSFLDEVATTCGIKLRVLSAEEEASYVYKGVINTMDVPRGLILEIGGGSTKIVHYNRKNLLNYETLPFGSVTLTELFATDGLAPEEQALKIEEFFTEQLKRIEWLKEVTPDTQLIGVGGSFRSLCKVCKKKSKSPITTVHNYRISVDEFNEVYDMIKVLDLDKKKRIKGVSNGRADIFPSALAAISSFIKYMQLDNIAISGCGLREGIMVNYALPTTIDKPVADVMTYSLQTLVKFYGCNQRHVEHVVNLSVQMFKQLRVLHKFPRQYLKILKVVAMLHDTGLSVRYYGAEKHTSYIIRNSAIYGVSLRELIMASMVAAVYKNDDFAPSDLVRFKGYIGEEDVEAIRKLGVMLRIAESLDRSMSGVVLGVTCDVLGDSVILKTEVEGDASLEIKDALSAAQDFRRIFRKNLEIL